MKSEPANQLLLPLSPRRPAPSNAQDDAAFLVLKLRGRGWVRAKQISAESGWPDRRIRAAAEAARGHILSGPGSDGYCVTREASADDRERVISGLRSQARRMLSRSIQLAKIHHAP